jgi:hypothetical protein
MDIPATLSDPVFGELVRNGERGTYEGSADWLGHPIQLSFSIEGRDAASGPGLVHALWRAKESLNERMRDAILRELLPTKNNNWLEDGEAAVTEAEMLARVRPQALNFYIDPDGAGFDFFFADGDLFWGHSIVVQGDSEDDALHVTLFG